MYLSLGNVVCRFEGAEEAQQIIARGPEPLTSQFSTSYGLVLNLLSVYSLEEAREFLSRSFGHYLSGEGNNRRLAEIQELEQKADELMQEFKSTATGTVKTLTVSITAD